MAEETEAAAEDRTEAATPRRLERAREEGQVALSREAQHFAALAGAALGLAVLLPSQGAELLKAFHSLLGGTHILPWDHAAAALLRLALLTVLPVAALAAAGATLSTLLQTRFLVSARGLRPQLSKLSPAAGLKRLFGAEGAIEFLRTLIKLALVGAALRWAIGDLAELREALHVPPGALLARGAALAFHLLLVALGAFAVIAGLDLLWVRFRHLCRMRMSREDLREELREAEGDPQIKARIRALRASRARGRMMAAVPKAAVVITNPTHYAVALSYERGSSAAPKLVAKGVDAIAARIRAMAEEHGVPLVANPPLARALYRLELDTEIPPEHYQAVAEIIAYVWRIGRGGG